MTLFCAKEKAREIEAERDARFKKEREEREELERLRVENERQARELAEARKLATAQVIQELRTALDTPVNTAATPQKTDREKLRAYGLALLRLPCDPIQDKEMRRVLEQVKILLAKVDKFIEEKTATNEQA